jgi:YHS domain-containing protein
MNAIDTTKLTIVTPDNWKNVTAKNIRAVLKAHYPKTKFSVTKEHYNCINVNWNDAPMQEDVVKLLAPFDINDNDSMTDYAGSKSTPFSETYGGVQYLFCHQELSEETQKQAIEEMAKEFPVWFNGYEEQPLTFENYKSGIARGGNGFYNHFSKAVRFVLTGEKEVEQEYDFAPESVDEQPINEREPVLIEVLGVKYPEYEAEVSFPDYNKNDTLLSNDTKMLRYSRNEIIPITKEIVLTDESFNSVSNNLLADNELWLDGNGVIIEDGIVVYNKDKSDCFVVYTNGYSYARNVGRMIVTKQDNYVKIVLPPEEIAVLKGVCDNHNIDTPDFNDIANITSDILSKMMA